MQTIKGTILLGTAPISKLIRHFMRRSGPQIHTHIVAANSKCHLFAAVALLTGAFTLLQLMTPPPAAIASGGANLSHTVAGLETTHTGSGGLEFMQSSPADSTAGGQKFETKWLVLSLIILLLIVSAIVYYMIYLQRKFLSACREENQLSTFATLPAGLPEGTIRSILTLIIVVFSLYLITLAAFGVSPEFPEVMAAILSTVIGFYFGSRTASAKIGGDGEMAAVRQQKDEAIAGRNESKAAEFLKKVDKNIAMVKTVMSLLPGDMKEKYGGVLDKLQNGANMAKELLDKGNLGAAAEKAEETFKLFVEKNPLRDIVTKAAASFSKVLGINIPPLALVGTVVGISTTLIGATYSRWKARILNMPFSPSVVPLKVVDADTGFVLMLQCPTLKEVFRDKLQGQDRPFLEGVTRDFLSQETDPLWDKYQSAFESREQFETGLQEFRSAAASLELQTEIDPVNLQEVGGFEPMMKAIDAVRQDPEAGADLGALIEITEGLQRANEPVKSIFDKIRAEVEK